MAKPDGDIKVVVAGASGRMGQAICAHLNQQNGIKVVAAYDKSNVGVNLRDLSGPSAPDLTVVDKLGQTLDELQPNVMVEVTHPRSACAHVMSAMSRGVACVIGTSGITPQDQREIEHCATGHKIPALIVPNFAIGAVLMMKFAEIAAHWMPDVEILEMHHDLKADAPSGTAKATAERISAARRSSPARREEIISVEGVRGGTHKDVRIHSMRLKGLVAHQQLTFGGPGEILTIRHDSMDRSSFMGGVELCVRKVWTLEGLTIGLDKLLV
ncbi:MAG: 4-hydroxy-tetrahydrodipicolinate reductase [Armatimonadetes bacterium]|nr:4-hydroxy-tetrahydrodipicolinate reductase [Armatimonadota bacterium]